MFINVWIEFPIINSWILQKSLTQKYVFFCHLLGDHLYFTNLIHHSTKGSNLFS
jgi:hypothetical protein